MPPSKRPARDQRELDIERRSRRLRMLDALTLDGHDIKAKLEAPAYAVKFLLVTIEGRIGRAPDDAWTMCTADLMAQTCIPYGTFYKAWKSLLALDLIIAEEQTQRGKGWYRMRICWPNLEDLVRPAQRPSTARRRHPEVNPDDSFLVSGGDEPVSPRDDPVPGRNDPVSGRNDVVSGRNGQSLPETDTVLTSQTSHSSPSPSQADAWVVVEREMFELSIVETSEPLRSLRGHQVSPSLAQAVLRLARETGAWSPAKVRRRLINLRPDQDPRHLQLWQPPDQPHRLPSELLRSNAQEQDRKVTDRDKRVAELEGRLAAYVQGRTCGEIAADFEVPDPLRSRLLYYGTWSAIRNDDVRLKTLEIIATAIKSPAAANLPARGER